MYLACRENYLSLQTTDSTYYSKLIDDALKTTVLIVKELDLVKLKEKKFI